MNHKHTALITILWIFGILSILISGASLVFNPVESLSEYGRLEFALISGHWSTLVVHVPLFFLGLILWMKESPFGRAILAGSLGAFAYNYLWLAIAVPLSAFYPAYLLLISTSFYLLLAVLRSIFKGEGRISMMTDKRHGFFLAFLALSYYFLWFQEIFQSLAAGNPLPHSLSWLTTTSPVHIIDVGFFLPALLITAWMIFQKRQIGGDLYLANYSMVIILGSGMIASRVFRWIEGVEFSKGSLFYLIFLILTGTLLLIRGYRKSPEKT